MKTERIPLTHRTWCKVLAFLLAVLTVLGAVACGFGIFGLWAGEVYTRELDSVQARWLGQIASEDACQVAYLLQNGFAPEVLPALSENVSGVRVSGPEDVQTLGTLAGSPITVPLVMVGYTGEMGETWYRYDPYVSEDEADMTVTLYLSRSLAVKDKYWLAVRGVELAYRVRYWVPVLGGLCLLLNVLCFVFLMIAAGRRREDREIHPGWGTKIPLELLLLGLGLAILGLGVVEWLVVYEYERDAVWPLLLALTVLLGTVGYCLLLGTAMSVALRIKLGTLFKNTLTYRIFRGLFWLLSRIPQAWKTLLLFAGASFAELLVFLAYCQYEGDPYILLWWLGKKLVELPLVIYGAASLQRLLRAGRRMAQGDFSPVNTGGLIWDLKRHGEDLNSLSTGMNRALEARVRSERMKTELITNVSHDIKTPLTSIINYADLIGREPCENENVRQYSQVLLRQSVRLKRLIEDLVEASKASTGNLEMHMAPLELGVLLTQTVGEYQSRLAEAELTLVEPKPQPPVYILADGKRLWRVMDNLMSNVLKYAQPGTRVYLDLQSDGRQAEISLRNVSRDMLNVPPAELLERFTRGDAARHSEGNGLGLSIANSLTQLQGGALLLGVDGDLFKVVLRFPVLQPGPN